MHSHSGAAASAHLLERGDARLERRVRGEEHHGAAAADLQRRQFRLAVVDQLRSCVCSRRSAAIIFSRPASVAAPASARNSRARENHATTIIPRMPSSDVEHDGDDEAQHVGIAFVGGVADDAADHPRQDTSRTR